MALSAERMRDFVKLDLGPALAAAHPGTVVFVRCDTRRREDLERVAEAGKAPA